MIISDLLKKTAFILCLLLTACGNEDDALTAFNAGNYDRAFELWKARAENGDIIAQNYLAIHYRLGLGVKADLQEAVRWYESAAKQGNPDAQKNLGMLYISHKLGNPNFEEAYIWLFAAYQQGNDNAAKGLETISGQLSPNRVQLLKQKSLQDIVNDVVDPENDDF